MVDQNLPERPNRIFPFKINPNLGLVEILNILQEQIKEEGGYFYGTIYDTQIEKFETNGEEFPKVNWSGELGLREPEQREKGSPLFPEDGIILPSDFSQFLASIFQKLLDYDNFKKFWDSLESEQQLNKEIEYLQDILIVETGRTTFPTKIDEQREIVNILKRAIWETLSYEEKEKSEPDDSSVNTDGEEGSLSPSSKGVSLPTSGSTGKGDAESQAEQESGVDDDLPQQPPEKNDKEKSQIQGQKLSSNVAFIYNHLAFDLAQIYGVDQQYFLNIDESIRSQINEQIITNVYATNPKQLSSLRFKIEQEVLQQILIYNQALSFKIQAHLLKNFPHDTPTEKALYAQLEERIKSLNEDSSFTKKIEAINNVRFKEYSDQELSQIDNLTSIYSIRTLSELDDDLIDFIKKTNPDLLNNPANIANLNKLVDVKILTKQSRQDVLTDKNLLAKAGISVTNEQENEIKKAIADQVNKKRVALSLVVEAADPNAKASSLTIVDGRTLSSQQKEERNLLESQLFAQKKDFLALHVAYHLSEQSVVSRRDQLLAEIQRQELENDFYNQIYLESQILDQNLNLSTTVSPIVFDTMNSHSSGSLANRLMSSKTTQSMLSDNLGKMAQLNPYLRAWMLARAHWQEIVAAILFLIYILTKLLALLLGAAIVLILPGGILWTALLGKNRLITIGGMSANLFVNAFNWVKGQTQAAWSGVSSVGSGIYKSAGGFLSKGVAKITGASVAEASGAILESGTLSTVAVGGAVATTAVSSLIAATTLGAFLQPDPAIIDEQEYSKYVSVSKRANVSTMENGETRDIIYSFSISPKENYVITPVLMNPVDTLSFLGGEDLNIQAPVNCVAEGIGTEPISESKRFTCTIEDVSGTDVMMINTFILHFTVEGVEGTQTIKSSASTKIGNPELGCFEFMAGGLDFNAAGIMMKSVDWSPEDMDQFQAAFSLVANNTQFISALCGAGNIELYRLNGNNYGGVAPRVYAGSKMGLYNLAFFPGAIYSTRYTIVHEFGHIILYRNSGIYSGFLSARQNNGCYSYTHICPSCSCNGDEAFSEAVTSYVNFGTFSSIQSAQYNLKAVDQGAYDYLKNNLFGGEEYY